MAICTDRWHFQLLALSFSASRSGHLYSNCLLLAHSFSSSSSSSSSSQQQKVSAHKDHYRTLGLTRDASIKDIKAAFFDLSKKHHPDMNPNNKLEAAEAFQNVSEAYEVLGSEEKRRIYDALTAERVAHQNDGIRRFHRTQSGHHVNSTRMASEKGTQRPKTWTDLDIDFKDFEHFQRESRRKRQFRRWQDVENANEQFWASYASARKYQNQQAIEREWQERRLHAEMEERKRREQIPTPTFEQLWQNEEERRRNRSREWWKIVFGTAPVLLVIFFCINKMR